MRDLILCALLFAGLPAAVARPFFGVLVFTWLGLMNPHRFTWGFAYNMPWSMMYAAAITLGMPFMKDTRTFDSIRLYWPVVLYIAWMGFTTVHAVSGTAAMRYQEVVKVHVICILSLAMLTTRARILWFSAVVIGSIAFFGVKGGLFTIINRGEEMVWGPPFSAIADNNHLAAGLIVILPLVYWATGAVTRPGVKKALVIAQLLVAVSILGSHSRGAMVAFVLMVLVLLSKSRHKLGVAAMVVVLAVVAVSFMPEKYWARMDTIKTYEEDRSAMGRINTWWTAFNVANDRLAGGGYEYYGSDLYLAHAPRPEDVHSSHSIYFQALGEHGWPGLAIYAVFLLSFWRNGRMLSRIRKRTPEDEIDSSLGRMLQVSLIGFMTAGAFVNIGNWDAIFYAYIICLAMNRLHGEARRAEEKAARRAPTRASRPPRLPLPTNNPAHW
jgi:putative inorganic carbon (hco3(-)) transporter